MVMLALNDANGILPHQLICGVTTMAKKQELSGNRYGRLMAIRPDGNIIDDLGRKRQVIWLCKCDCGGEARVKSHNLLHGDTRSCGCLQREVRKSSGKQAITHGMSYSPEYRAWGDMRRRCVDVNFPEYKNYGGRGISVCPEWQTFEQFFFDMGTRPSDRHSLDRINNDGNYEPGNCRWASRSQQVSNKTSSLIVEAFGRRAALCEFVARGTPEYKRAQDRIQRGWDAEKALTTPSKRGPRQ
jgi:hypothetical protein